MDTSVSEVIGPRLLGLSTLELRETLAADPALRSADVLQYLTEVAHEELDRRPGRALEIMDTLMPFAETVEVASQDPVGGKLFHANALKVHALALRVTHPARAEQQIRAALDLVDEDAQPHFHARLQLVEAVVLDAGDRQPRALALARTARGMFEELGDRSMVLMARQIEAAVLTALHREEEALQIFTAALDDARSLADTVSETRLMNNVGLLQSRQGRLREAGDLFSQAAERFQAHDMQAEAARARRGGARILLSEGRFEDALAQLVAVHHEMEAAGCGEEAVSVSLDVARALTRLDRRREARTICLDAAEWCSAAGFPARALEALEQLRGAWNGANDGFEPDRRRRSADSSEEAAREGAEAEELLRDLLASQYRFEQARIARKKRFRTAAVTRRLCKASHEHRDQDPRFSLSLAAIAIAITETFIENWVARETIHELAGQAWTAYGDASLKLNRLDDAMDAYARAEEELAGLPDPDALLATVRLGRAVVHWAREHWAPALACVRSAASTFAAHHDMPRLFEAKQVEAMILERKGDGAAACTVYELTMALAKTMDDPELQGRAVLNLATAHLDTGNVDAAKDLFTKAVGIFQSLGASAPLARARAGIARSELAAGHTERATTFLRQAEGDLRGLGLNHEANAVLLSIAEAFLQLGIHGEVRSALTSLVASFRSASPVTGAATAASFLAEAARGQRLTAQQIQTVRQYLRELQRKPDMVFVAPSGDQLVIGDR